jgi:ABC-type bacteriocin/lantibiotic exporter with double-glycine peptidase domain
MGSIWVIDQLTLFRTSITPEGKQDSNDYEPPTDWPTQGRISFQNVSFRIKGKEKLLL